MHCAVLLPVGHLQGNTGCEMHADTAGGPNHSTLGCLLALKQCPTASCAVAAVHQL
jgi:hypothetical protein